jgi:hypothetical protein
MSKQASVQGFASVMAKITFVGIIALPLLSASLWLAPDLYSDWLRGTLGLGEDKSGIALSARFAGCAVSLAGAGLQVYGLLGLRRTFQETAAGHWLSLRSVTSFRRFAWVSVAIVPVGIIQASAYSAILSAGNPSIQNVLTVSIGSAEVTALFTALAFVFAAHVFAAGRKAEAENESFV